MLVYVLVMAVSSAAIASDKSHGDVLIDAVETAGNDFVRRQGSRLVLHGQPFRFGAANLPGLGMDELPKREFPSRFRIDDALGTAALMGARVVRSHTLGISTGHEYSFWCNGWDTSNFK